MGLDDVIAWLSGGSSSISAPEQREVVGRKMDTARRLWHGDDEDAVIARAVLDVCATMILLPLGDPPAKISAPLYRTMTHFLGEAIDTVDELAGLGVVRSAAQQRPTPDDPTWLTQDDRPAQG